MKEKHKDSRIGDLAIDVIEYAFTEWLIRRGLFAAFKANYDACYPSSKGFRERLRVHIQACFCNPYFGPSQLISSAFLYTSTSEGTNFWLKQSTAWKEFYASLETKF